MAKKKTTKTEKVLKLIKARGGLTFKQINKQISAQSFLYGTSRQYGLLGRFVTREGDKYVATKFPPDEAFYAVKPTSTDNAYPF